MFCWNYLNIGTTSTFSGNANVKFRFLLSALIAAFLVVGTAAHGATHDYAAEIGQELVDCQGCHLQASEAEELDLECFFSTQTALSNLIASITPQHIWALPECAPPKF